MKPKSAVLKRVAKWVIFTCYVFDGSTTLHIQWIVLLISIFHKSTPHQPSIWLFTKNVSGFIEKLIFYLNFSLHFSEQWDFVMDILKKYFSTLINHEELNTYLRQFHVFDIYVVNTFISTSEILNSVSALKQIKNIKYLGKLVQMKFNLCFAKGSVFKN